MPLRIWVIGSRTSSAPSGKATGVPAAAGAAARLTAGMGAPAGGPRRRRRAVAAEEPFAAAMTGTGAAPPVRMVSTTARTSSRVIRPPPPVPTTWAAVRPCSRSRRRTAGVMRASGSASAGAGAATGAAAGAVAAGAGAVGGTSRGLVTARGARGRRRRRGGIATGGRVQVAWLEDGHALGRRLGRDRAGHGCGVSAPPSSAVSMMAISASLGTVAPSSARISLRIALERGRDLGVDLVGDDLEQGFVLVDMIAGLLEPLADRPLGDALAELGHRHLRHVRCSSRVAGCVLSVPPSLAHPPGLGRAGRVGRTVLRHHAR